MSWTLDSSKDGKQSVNGAGNKHRKTWTRAIWLASLLIAGNLFGADGAPPTHAPDRILVKPKDNVAESTVQATFARHGVREHHAVKELNVRVLQVNPNQLEDTLAKLKNDPNIEFAEKDGIASIKLTPNDPYFSSEWHLADISAPQAWDLCTGSSGVVIAVLDTGICLTHPDFQGKILPGYNYVSSNTNVADDNGHGTWVAGTATADSNNGTGVASVAWGTKILPVKVADSTGYAYYSSIASGINYAVAHGARVINISIAGTTSSSTLQNAMNYAWSKNVVVVCAAGNYGNSAPEYPAACVNAVAVSGLEPGDTLAGWSSYGSYVTVCAPGDGIITTDRSGGYSTVAGTSFSSPIVAGVVALMASANPSLSNAQIVSILKSTATDLGASGYDVSYGYGKVNAYEAVLSAISAPGGDTTPPTVSIAAPGTGSTVSNTVPVSVNATDNVSVSKVEFYVNGTLTATDTAAPWNFSWDSTKAGNGTYTLLAKAYDPAGNVGTSAAVSVTVQNSVPDTTPPTVAITSPTSGSTVSGVVPVSVNATDNVSVAKVEFYVNGTLMATDTASPYNFSWNTSGLAVGSYTLMAKAYDQAGNTVTSSVSASIADTTPPAAAITSPANGCNVSGTVTVSVTASDNVSVARVELYANGTLIGSDTAAPWNFSWNASGCALGSYTLMAKAYDPAGNVATSSVTVNIADTTPPAVTITSPVNGSTVSGAVTVSASATDNASVARVELYANGTLIGSDTAAPWNFSWNTTTVPNGLYTLTAKACDAAGNTATSSVSVTVQNSTPPAVTITSPSDGSTITTQTLSVCVTTTDNNSSVTKVCLYIDGKLFAYTTTHTSPTFNWYTGKVASGPHTLQAVACDAAGNSGSSSIVTITK